MGTRLCVNKAKVLKTGLSGNSVHKATLYENRIKRLWRQGSMRTHPQFFFGGGRGPNPGHTIDENCKETKPRHIRPQILSHREDMLKNNSETLWHRTQ
jgi:hypothetical protein